VAKINRFYTFHLKSPAIWTGLFCLLILLSACQTPKTPEEVTKAFWAAMLKGDIEEAKKHVTQNSRQLITEDEAKDYKELHTGQIVINGQAAKVETTMTQNNRTFSFNTVLLKENDIWQVDYQQTLMNVSAMPFNGLFRSLDKMGEDLNKKLEQQMPLFEKQIESFGQELNRKLDEFGQYLEDPKKWKKQHPEGNSI
jgi:hypothetical protein